MEEYDDFIKENSEILSFIDKNDLVLKLDFADEEAKQKSEMEGGRYLHSYRYSSIYDALKENVNINSLEYGRKAIAIVRLLENKYNKTISELIKDSISKKDMEIN